MIAGKFTRESLKGLYEKGQITKQDLASRVQLTPKPKLDAEDYKYITGEDYTGEVPPSTPSLQSQVNALEIKTSLIAEEVNNLGGGN